MLIDSGTGQFDYDKYSLEAWIHLDAARAALDAARSGEGK